MKLWKDNSNNFKTFRADRDKPTKECGKKVTLIIPSSRNSKVRYDLNYMNKKTFQSLWIECSEQKFFQQANTTHKYFLQPEQKSISSIFRRIVNQHRSCNC